MKFIKMLEFEPIGIKYKDFLEMKKYESNICSGINSGKGHKVQGGPLSTFGSA